MLGIIGYYGTSFITIRPLQANSSARWSTYFSFASLIILWQEKKRTKNLIFIDDILSSLMQLLSYSLLLGNNTNHEENAPSAIYWTVNTKPWCAVISGCIK